MVALASLNPCNWTYWQTRPATRLHSVPGAVTLTGRTGGSGPDG